MSINQENHAIAHEESDLNVRALAPLGIGLVAALALVFVVVSLTLTVFTGQAPELTLPPRGIEISANTPAALPPEPRLQAVPGEELRALRAAEEGLLHRYDWVDRKAGVVRIPIARAMELLLARGLPTRPEAERQKLKDQGQDMPSDSSSGRMMERLIR